LFKLDTPRSQAIVGATAGAKQSSSNLSVHVTNRWTAVLATSLEDRPIARAARILISAVGNAVNRGMTFEPSGAALTDAGTSPVLLEPMSGTVVLTGLTEDTTNTNVYYLSISGQRRAAVPVQTGPGTVSFDLKPEYKTLHYEVVRSP
jgi:hypothetical protein